MCFYIIYHYILIFQTNTGFPKTSTLIIDNMENISSLLFGKVFLAALSTDQLYISKCKMGFPNVDVICFVCKVDTIWLTMPRERWSQSFSCLVNSSIFLSCFSFVVSICCNWKLFRVDVPSGRSEIPVLLEPFQYRKEAGTFSIVFFFDFALCLKIKQHLIH